MKSTNNIISSYLIGPKPILKDGIKTLADITKGTGTQTQLFTVNAFNPGSRATIHTTQDDIIAFNNNPYRLTKLPVFQHTNVIINQVPADMSTMTRVCSFHFITSIIQTTVN